MEYDHRNKDNTVRRTKDRRALMRKMDEDAYDRKKKSGTTPVAETGLSGDMQEQEADAVAKKVVNGADATAEISTSPKVQLKEEAGVPMAKSEAGALKGTGQLQSKLNSTKGSGSSLDAATRDEMGSRMDADLSDVKIHTDSKAHEMSEGINAKAFTHGQDIYFKEGNFGPGSNEGKELLAHELVHTVQQKGEVSRKVQRKDDKLTEKQKALITGAGFDPETMPEEDAGILASMLSILEMETASAEGQGVTKEKRKVGEYDIVTETKDRLRTISLTGKDNSLLISVSEDDEGASTNTVEFSNKGNKYSATHISAPLVLKLDQPVQQGKGANPKANSGSAKATSLLNNPFQLGVPAYKLVKTIKGKGKLYISENILEQRRQYNPEFNTFGGNEIIYRRSIKIETEEGTEIYISVKGSDVPAFNSAGSLMDVKGKTELEISIDGKDSAQNELHIFSFENKDDSSFNDAIQAIAGRGPSAHLMERVPLDEKYYDEVIKCTSLFWQAQPKKQAEEKENPDAIKAEKNSPQEEKAISYPSKEELAAMNEKEKLQLAKDKFLEEFKIGNVLTNVRIGLGIMGVIVILAGTGIITAIVGVIAGAVIGIGAVIYSYWDSVFKHLLSGDFDKIEPPDAVKAALYIISIIAGTVALLASSPAIIAAATIIAVAAFVSAIIYGTFLAYKEVEKAASSLTPAEFKEHTQKAARHAEQATSDAIMGLIAKYFAKIIETNKPLIGPQNENAGPGMGPDKSKLPVIVEEKKPVMAEENVKKPAEETVKDIDKPKEKDKFDKEKDSNENNKKINKIINDLFTEIDPVSKNKKYFIKDVEVGTTRISKNGYISFDLTIPEGLQKQEYGTYIFQDAIDFYSKRMSVNGIQAKWLTNSTYEGGASVNLKTFKESYIDKGLSYENAALNTPTGKISSRSGFSKVIKGDWDILDLGASKPAEIYWMELKFIKP